MEKLDRISGIIWERCIRPKKSENALIVSDSSCKRIAESIFSAGKSMCSCELVFIRQTARNGAEPEARAAEMMIGKDILICPTKNSLTHTIAVGNARKSGARAITLPGITEDMYLRCIDVDYGKMRSETQMICGAVYGKDLRITTTAGTDMFIPLGKRKIINFSGVPLPGGVANLPDGEACTAPIEGRSEGRIVVDTAKKPFTITVEKGEMADCTDKRFWDLHGVKNGKNLAELGIGTNPKARITGKILEDEKVKGTAHIAFGTNKSLGGTVQSSVHIDYIFWKPTIESEGTLIMSKGKLV